MLIHVSAISWYNLDMFTGIIEELGIVQHITSNAITVECSKILNGTSLGESIAVNGICLTVTNVGNNCFMADISPETYNITSLCEVKSGDYVNLERAMSANGRFGGHIVSGHIDGRGRGKCVKNGSFYNFEAEIPSELSKYIVKKGSVTINGISLTVADIKNNTISCAVIPHTFDNTNLKTLKCGDFVNIEVDIFAKYIEKFLSTGDNRSRINYDFLKENGFASV